LEIDRLLANIREQRHRMYRLPPDFNDWSDAERTLASDVSAVYQRVAYLWYKGLLELRLFEAWGRTFIDTWDFLAPWILQYRIETNAANQRIHLELLVTALREDPELMETFFPD
jgi:hypothetical protein